MNLSSSETELSPGRLAAELPAAVGFGKQATARIVKTLAQSIRRVIVNSPSGRSRLLVRGERAFLRLKGSPGAMRIGATLMVCEHGTGRKKIGAAGEWVWINPPAKPAAEG